jgi:hypothetical protein
MDGRIETLVDMLKTLRHTLKHDRPMISLQIHETLKELGYAKDGED